MFNKMVNCGNSLSVRQWSLRDILHKKIPSPSHANSKPAEKLGRKARSLRPPD